MFYRTSAVEYLLRQRIRRLQMTPTELRVQFLDFCGPTKFRKFARSLVKLSDEPVRFDRLRFWQELLWAQFVGRCPDAPKAVNDIGSCLHWCDLHDASLVVGPGHQPIDLRHSDSFDSACENQFPHGYGWLGYHCSACRTSCIAWIDVHPAECSMLQYRIYDANWVTMHRSDPDFLKTCRDAYLPWDEICPGDEIWMIDTGRDSPGMGLVRNGRIVPIMD
jgi:hypothetical protein